MFQLDPKSRKSIYEQVIDNLKELIMTGTLEAGEKLPSVRDLSKTITVNPNTVQKAYRELERQGYTYTQSGLGTFVSNKKEIAVDEKELEKAKSRLEDAVKQLSFLGLPMEKVKAIVSEAVDKVEPFSSAQADIEHVGEARCQEDTAQVDKGGIIK